jgi:hypothetical protein
MQEELREKELFEKFYTEASYKNPFGKTQKDNKKTDPRQTCCVDVKRELSKNGV